MLFSAVMAQPASHNLPQVAASTHAVKKKDNEWPKLQGPGGGKVEEGKRKAVSFS